jgi:hypothetical protein
MELFETAPKAAEVDHIDNFYATQVFDDNMSKEIWFSPDGGCLDVTTTSENVYSGTGALHLNWDLGKGGCDWVGMGIGWENWSGKNLGSIYDHAALSFKVRTDGKALKNLPIAFAFEDYGDLQAWVGFNRKMLDVPEITKEWSTVTIPLLAFNWGELDTDITNIKQLVIQFFASGDFYMDDVRIIEHQGSIRSRVDLPLLSGTAKQEEVFSTMLNDNLPVIKIEEHRIDLAIQNNVLYLVADIVDDTPLQNINSGDDLWKGDAIEIAFSSNAKSSQSRTFFLVSDKQVGIRATVDQHIWDWRAHKEIKGAISTTEITSNGYRLKASIPLGEIGVEPHVKGEIYGLEIAIDLGDESGRETQLRWNNPDTDGFHENPSLWGEMKIIEQ